MNMSYYITRHTCAMVSAVCLFAGCQQPSERPAVSAGPAGNESARMPAAGEADIRGPREDVVIGRSVQGRPIVCHMYGSTGPVVIIVGAIHGNEPASAMLCRELLACLDRHPEMVRDRRVLVIPVANPDGLEMGTRYSARGIDLNRNYPADNWRMSRRNGHEPLCEPESRALYDVIRRYRPDRVVSIHQPLGLIDYDGPAEALAHAMAARCGLPVKRIGARSGSLGSYVAFTMKIPIVTYELPRDAHQLDTSDRWERYGPALLQAIKWAGAVTDSTTTEQSVTERMP